jgi:hypothetical protein
MPSFDANPICRSVGGNARHDGDSLAKEWPTLSGESWQLGEPQFGQLQIAPESNEGTAKFDPHILQTTTGIAIFGDRSFASAHTRILRRMASRYYLV